MYYISHVFPGVLPLLSERFRASWEWAFPGVEPPPEPRLTFGSWVGGDRDGHPFVTTAITRHALEARAPWRWAPSGSNSRRWPAA